MTIDHHHAAAGPQPVGVALSGVLGASWIGWLPPLAALVASLFAIAWYAIQIWESRTVTRWRSAGGRRAPDSAEGPT